jgi:hypothetical protein
MAIGGEMNALFEQMMRTAQSASSAFSATSKRKSDASAHGQESKGLFGLSNPFSAAMQPLLFPTADPAELDKKIADLTVVKAWLETTTQTIELSIKALEYQRSLLTSFSSKAASPEETPQEDASKLNPALWAWDMMQKAGAQLQSASESVVKTATETMASAKEAATKSTTKKTAKKTVRKSPKNAARKAVKQATTRSA